MNKRLFKAFSLITILALMLAGVPMQSAGAAGSVSLTTFGSAYTQNFDTLTNTPDNGTSNVVPTGWEFSESGTSANTTYLVGTGSINTGDTYSFGATNNTDRAFGGLRSGNLVPLIGAQFTNNTGGTITSLDISYTGEQWRLGQNTTGRAADRLDFQLSTDATSITTGTWTNYDSLDFSSPVVAGTVGALNGNSSATSLSFSITGLSIASGASFWIRWADTDLIPGADDGLSVDNFSLTPSGVVSVLEPKINEFSASTAGTDVEYVEIFGTPNTDYSAYKILEIEGDAGTGVGTVEEVISLGTTDANGLYLFNLPANALENGTISLLLVKNFTGAINSDLDADNNGTLDTTPWDSIADSVAVNDGGAGDVTYGVPTLGVSYDGAPFAPGGASRIPDGFDTDAATDWVRNDFDLAGIPTFTGTPVYGEAYNTPGALNSVVLPKLVINEIDYDQPSTDTAEYVEIRNNEMAAVSLNGWTLELVNGNLGGAAVYDTITLPNVSLAAGDYFVVCANAATVVNCDLDDAPDTNFIQNGSPDAVGLRFNGVLIDTVSYTGDTAAPYTEGSGTGLADSAVVGQSISRCPNGSDTNVNNVDFTLANITPGAANDCASITPQLTVTDASFNEGNSGTTTFTFNVNLSIPAPSGGATFNIATADGTAQDDVPPTEDNDYVAKSLTSQFIPAGASTYAFTVSVNGDTTSEGDETFFVNVTSVTGANVIDSQGLGTIVNDDGLAITFIHDIQGSGSAVTGTGPFAVEAIVVGDYQTQGTGQLRGFFIQEEDADADANAATSEGIFVFCSGCPTAVSVGDKVRVTGSASDFNGMSQLTATTAASVSVLSSGNPLPSPATIQLPVPGGPFASLAAATTAINAYYEPFEGMLVSFPDTLSVSEYFELARYGQVILSEGGRLRQFTDGNLPSTTGYTDHLINLATRKIILDDTDNRENRPVDSPNTAYYHPVPGLSTGNFFRGGDTITNLTGVLHWSFAGGPSANAWRIRPVTETYPYAFTSVNPRPSVPNVGGTTKVASFNVLNYFLTIDTTAGDSGICGAATTLDCRGPDSVAERDRQQAKLTQALKGLDADVFGMIELENTPNVDPLGEIVADLNAATAPGTFAAINTGVVGTDAIKVGFIYKPGSVTPVGAPMIDNDPIHNRPPVAQLFETPAGGRFTVVINHFKSKGCDGASGLNLDQNDGQSCFNAQRVSQAQALVDFVNDIVLTTGDPDVLIIGDLNAYAKENPITTLEGAGFTNLVAAFGGAGAYSYLFDSQLGYLDHALATSSLTPQISGVADWHINADEIPLFDYNDEVRDTGEATFEEESDVLPLYQANEFRTSDHDPVVIGLTPNAPPTVDAGGPYSVGEGSSVNLSATGSDPNGDSLSYAWDLDNNGSYETTGQSASFNAALLDGPTSATVKVKVTDALGLSAESTATVNVTNVDPLVTYSAAAGNLSCGPDNANYTISFSDPAPADTHTAVVDWGDGNVENLGTVTSPFTITHTYALAGSYTATVTVTDDDGGDGSTQIIKAVSYNTSGFLQPINSDGTSVFKYGSTIPVKVIFSNCDGSVPTNLAPTITLTMVSGATPGLQINEPVSTSAADTTGVLRFSSGQYMYNLATRSLPDPSATYQITVTIPSTGQTVTVNFGLRP